MANMTKKRWEWIRQEAIEYQKMRAVTDPDNVPPFRESSRLEGRADAIKFLKYCEYRGHK